MPTEGPRHSLEAVLAAVDRGVTVTGAAAVLGVHRHTMQRYQKRWQAVDNALLAKRDELVDLAESKLRLAVLAGEPWAIPFTLRTLGKSRGYVERAEVEHHGADGGDLTFTIRIDRPDGEGDGGTPQG